MSSQMKHDEEKRKCLQVIGGGASSKTQLNHKTNT